MFEWNNIQTATLGAGHWMSLFGNSSPEGHTGLEADSGNYIFITGYAQSGSSKVLDAKIDRFGNLIWQTLTQMYSTAGTTPLGLPALGVDNQGYHYNFNIVGENLVVNKVNTDGVIVMSKSVATPAASFADSVYDLTLDSSNNIHVVGVIQPTVVGSVNVADGYMMKMANDGTSVWQKRLSSGTTYTDALYANYIDSSNNVYAVGAGNGTQQIVKFDSSGTLQWSKSFNSGGSFWDVVGNSDGIYVAGDADPDSGTQADLILVKFGTSGNLIWQVKIGTTTAQPESEPSISLDRSGNIYVYSSARDYSYILKFNNSGILIWANKISGDTGREFYSSEIKIDSEDNIVINGRTNNTGQQGSFDGYIMRLPNDGSKTGTYYINSGPITYSNFTPTVTKPTYTATTGGLSVFSAAYTVSTESITAGSGNLVYNKTDI